MTAAEARRTLRKLANPSKAKFLQRFFKTGPGEYAQGDKFLGIVVPDTRKVSREFRELPRKEIESLLKSQWHEERLLALCILVLQFKKSKDAEREQIYHFYLKHKKHINNWDLVDVSAHHICGPYLENRDKKILYKLAASKNLWDRRIAVLCTFHFIRKGKFTDILKLSDRLLADPEDLMHKAVGWMLREVGKKDLPTLKRYLKKNYRKMPRTMLRYSIEKFPEKQRKAYLNGSV